ncbi:MAG: ATP-binding protein [Pseudomonadota bacterium]|nr:ATP-binding protein [Pseudomonadota bacterium]
MLYQPTALIAPKHEHRILALVLITWHIILWWGLTSVVFSRLLLLIHLGLFVLWQPLWIRGNPPLFRQLSVIGISLILFVIFFNPWLATLWQMILIGLMGGRDLVKPRDRLVNMFAIFFLIAHLLIMNVHLLFFDDLMLIAHFTGVQYVLFIIPIMFLFIATDNSLEYRYQIDFFHGLTLVLLITIITLGSLVMMHYSPISYPLALFQMSLTVALFMLIISWLGVMLTGEEGINPLWNRHLFNMGSSFEQWLDNLAQPINYKVLTPEQFLNVGFEQLVTLPWISGIAWHSPYGTGLQGHQDKYLVTINVQSLEVSVYSHYRISGSHYFHIKILIQLLEYFHQAKRREAAFAQQAHLQAIHEAGAKLTHDIKNLLQSLHAITSAIETCQPAQFGDTQRLLQGQMPHLTQRLKRTLDKLQKPAEFSYSNIPINLWWENLQARYRKSQIEFINYLDTDKILIPEDLFDNVSENLLQNALMKRKREPNLHIKVSLNVNQHRLQLIVSDDGSAIPKEIESHLLTQPVPSRDGFGIGLYQAVKQLAHTGYQLRISHNEEGQVCFELSSTE